MKTAITLITDEEETAEHAKLAENAFGFSTQRSAVASLPGTITLTTGEEETAGSVAIWPQLAAKNHGGESVNVRSWRDAAHPGASDAPLLTWCVSA